MTLTQTRGCFRQPPAVVDIAATTSEEVALLELFRSQSPDDQAATMRTLSRTAAGMPLLEVARLFAVETNRDVAAAQASVVAFTTASGGPFP